MKPTSASTNKVFLSSDHVFLQICAKMKLKIDHINGLQSGNIAFLNDAIEIARHDGMDKIKNIIESYNEIARSKVIRRPDLTEEQKESFEKSPWKKMQYEEKFKPLVFSVTMIKQLIGLIHYMHICVHVLHKCPSLCDITEEDLEEFSSYYDTYSSNAATVSNEEIVDSTIPQLNDIHNWINFRDKLSLKLTIVRNEKRYCLSYVLDDTPRFATRKDESYLTTRPSDIDDLNPRT